MRIFEMGSTYRVLPDSKEEERTLKRDLMGWHQQRGDPYIKVESNNINKLILGLPLHLDMLCCEPSGELNPQLKDYQVQDVMKLLSLKCAINANPMGLGKTVETIELLRQAQAQSVLIVTPKIIRTQWVAHIQKWWNREATILDGKIPIIEPNKVYIINYDKLWSNDVLAKLRRFSWDYLVLDEAHKIKSRNSKQTIAVKQIPSQHKLCLTGTPILRYADDLWSILNFLGPQYSGTSYWSFVEYFCQVEETPWGKRIVGTTKDIRRQQLLKEYLSMFMVRHNAVEVAHGKTTEVVRLPMSKAQRDLYRKEKQLLLDQLPENCTISNGAVLTMRLRQTTSWPGLFIDNLVGPKFEWIKETCESNPDESFVVFTAYEKTATALAWYLRDKGITPATITGQNNSMQNECHKRAFLDKKAQVLIGTIGAMGQGYDELQTVCRVGIFLERDWSPEINAQAEDRLHRMGQQHPVHIVYLECQGSVDQYVGRINANKSEGIRQALCNEEDT